MVPVFQKLYVRELAKLKTEIELYRQEEKIWCREKQIGNTAGNLCLHLIGNLKTYIGAALGGFEYTRNRELEFSSGPVPRAALLAAIEETTAIVTQTLAQLTESRLEEDYPQEVTDGRVSNGYFLTYLAMHLSYHLGQINYHRRLLDNE